MVETEEHVVLYLLCQLLFFARFSNLFSACARCQGAFLLRPSCTRCIVQEDVVGFIAELQVVQCIDPPTLRRSQNDFELCSDRLLFRKVALCFSCLVKHILAFFSSFIDPQRLLSSLVIDRRALKLLKCILTGGYQLAEDSKLGP